MELYNENCAVCHGENGDGKGPLATGFTPRPRDLTKGVFKFKSSETGDFPAQTDLVNTIRRGITGSYGQMMPAFDHFSEDELLALTEVIRVAAGAPRFGTLIVPSPPQNPDLARGEELYSELGCIDCHGKNGDGRGLLADDLTDSNDLSIRPADLRVGQFKGGNDPGDIWMRLYNGIEGTPMPSLGRNVSGDEMWFARRIRSDVQQEWKLTIGDPSIQTWFLSADHSEITECPVHRGRRSRTGAACPSSVEQTEIVELG